MQINSVLNFSLLFGPELLVLSCPSSSLSPKLFNFPLFHVSPLHDLLRSEFRHSRSCCGLKRVKVSESTKLSRLWKTQLFIWRINLVLTEDDPVQPQSSSPLFSSSMTERNLIWINILLDGCERNAHWFHNCFGCGFVGLISKLMAGNDRAGVGRLGGRGATLKIFFIHQSSRIIRLGFYAPVFYVLKKMFYFAKKKTRE